MVKRNLKQLIRRWGYEVNNVRLIPPAFLREDNLLRVNFDLIIAQHILQSPDFFFMQVGAFDGIECDPLRKHVLRHGWKGVLIEPQKKAFQNLQNNYVGQPQLAFENVAVARQSGKQELYTVGSGDVPEWCRGLASFDRDVILKHRDLVVGLEDLVQTEEVTCMTFTALIDRYQIKKLDLLQIDAEGYDAELIQMFPFDLLCPSIVHFERKHLSKSDLECCLQLLVSNGYRFANDGAEDVVASRENGSHNASPA